MRERLASTSRRAARRGPSWANRLGQERSTTVLRSSFVFHPPAEQPQLPALAFFPAPSSTASRVRGRQVSRLGSRALGTSARPGGSILPEAGGTGMRSIPSRSSQHSQQNIQFCHPSSTIGHQSPETVQHKAPHKNKTSPARERWIEVLCPESRPRSFWIWCGGIPSLPLPSPAHPLAGPPATSLSHAYVRGGLASRAP